MMEDLQPYPEYKDSGVPWLGEIPSHWKSTRLDRLFTLRNEPPFDDDERVTAYINGRVTNRKNIPGQKIKGVIKEAGWQRIYPGDFAISGMNAHMGGMGVSDSLGKCSPIYLVLIPKPQINAQFISHFVRFEAEIGLIRSLIQTIRFNSADFKRNDLKSLYVWYPPIDEQTQICDVIDWINAKVNKFINIKKHQISLLNEQKQAIIHLAVTRGLDPSVPMKPSGIEWLGEIPEHWEIIRLKYLTESNNRGIQMGPFGSMLTNIESKKTGFKLYGQENTIKGNFVIGDRWLSKEQFSELSKYIITEGDLILTRKGSIGHCQIVPNGVTPGIADSDTIRVRPNYQIINADYLVIILRESRYLMEQLLSIKRGAIIAGLNTSTIANLKILLPPIEEQKSILTLLSNKCSKVDNVIKSVDRDISLIREYRTRLITDVVTGKLDVRSIAATLPDIEDIPLEETGEEEAEEEYTDEEE